MQTRNLYCNGNEIPDIRASEFVAIFHAAQNLLETNVLQLKMPCKTVNCPLPPLLTMPPVLKFRLWPATLLQKQAPTSDPETSPFLHSLKSANSPDDAFARRVVHLNVKLKGLKAVGGT